MAAETLSTPPLVYNSAKSAVTVTADFSSASLKASDYSSSVVTITGASRTKALNIEGNSKANKIIGTSGNDTLTGGDGADIFLYDGKGSDATFKVGSGSVKISDGKSKAITVIDLKNSRKLMTAA